MLIIKNDCIRTIPEKWRHDKYLEDKFGLTVWDYSIIFGDPNPDDSSLSEKE